jgi:hypothetical protein
MGNKSEVKVLRGQLRQIVKDMLPELLATEMFQALQQKNKAELEFIKKQVIETLERIDSRQADVQSMILRELTSRPIPPHIPSQEPEVVPVVAAEELG